MTSYNRLNGTHCSEHKELLDGILRGEWGWNGLVCSDWTGVVSVDESIKAGLDVEMPGPPVMRGKPVNRALGAGKLTLEDIDDRARNVLELVNHAIDSGIPFYAGEDKVDTPELRALLREAAANATVLLKNDMNLLPLDASSIKGKRIAVVGLNAKVAFPSGGGSASLAPSWLVSALDGVTEAAEEFGATVEYTAGVAAFRYVPLLDPYLTHPTTGKQGALIEFRNGKPDEQWFKSADVPKSSKPDWSTDTNTSLCFMIDGVPWSKLDKHVRSRVRVLSLSRIPHARPDPLMPLLPAVRRDLHARPVWQVDVRPRVHWVEPALPRRQAHRRERRVVRAGRALLQHGLAGEAGRDRGRGGPELPARAAWLRRPGEPRCLALHLLVVVPHWRVPDRRARGGAQGGCGPRRQLRRGHRRRRHQPGLGERGLRQEDDEVRPALPLPSHSALRCGRLQTTLAHTGSRATAMSSFAPSSLPTPPPSSSTSRARLSSSPGSRRRRRSSRPSSEATSWATASPTCFSARSTRRASSRSPSRAFFLFAIRPVSRIRGSELIPCARRGSVRLEDNPAYHSFGLTSETPGKVVYGEGIYTGYRHYDRLQVAPAFPFGHGLSYTTFKLSSLSTSPVSDDGDLTVSFEVQNAGKLDGAEVAQVYIAAPADGSRITSPRKELKAFEKVALRAGETKKVEVKLSREAFSYWNERYSKWVAPKGEYEVLVSTSSADKDIKLRGPVSLPTEIRWSGL